MISSKQLQSVYKKLYTSLRQYVWPAPIVSDLADLEISVYKTFPDLQEVRDNYNRLKSKCLRYVDDEELESNFDRFREVLEQSDLVFAKLDVRIEGEKLDENFKK